MKNLKLGFQSKRVYSYKKWFNEIRLPRKYRFLKEYNLVIDTILEEQKLYNAQACVYTDKRFEESLNKGYVSNFYWSRYTYYHLDSCIRKVNRAYGIPKGTIVEFLNDWFWKNADDTSFKLKVKNYKPNPYTYNIDIDEYSKLFTDDHKSNELIVRLRQEGFIVRVYPKWVSMDLKYVYEEYAVAYGYNKKIGFSCFNNSLNGYSDSHDNILFDEFGYFDKWSRCIEIPKRTPLEEIIQILKTPYKYE